MSSIQKDGRKSRVSYFYDSEVGNYHYGPGHPMKPHRVRMAHELIVNYDMYKYLDVYEEMTRFHADDYINFLQMITPDNMAEYRRQLQRFNVGDDCPVFDGLYEFCQIYTSGSMGGASLLNHGRTDIAVNFAGGLHHAKKSEASGFCYVNDCVLGILELLKRHQRVLYIDIDIHHGDGVEEAFYTTDRVMTCSFHKYGEYFPGTGDVLDVGTGKGKGYSVNFPLRDGMDDEAFEQVFRPVIAHIMEFYRPEAVLMQCGADSLCGDRLGCFNLTLKGHASALEYVKSFGIPMLVVGGGGYTMKNVARCWAYETSRLLEEDVPDQLPYNRYFEYFGPDYRLHITPSNMENKNTRPYLERIMELLCEQLRDLPHVPSVQMQTGSMLQTPELMGVPPKEETHPDARPDPSGPVSRKEFYDSEQDQDRYRSEAGIAEEEEEEEEGARGGNQQRADATTVGATQQAPSLAHGAARAATQLKPPTLATQQPSHGASARGGMEEEEEEEEEDEQQQQQQRQGGEGGKGGMPPSSVAPEQREADTAAKGGAPVAAQWFGAGNQPEEQS